uniref:Retrovirus-related Pol polyprotein from transposon TNT 1-94-like beta-barrel domain-containing protein n=1 Tax=Micrurus spixii TaxID=129469 RepID=A0A2D4LZD1_9SAUR
MLLIYRVYKDVSLAISSTTTTVNHDIWVVDSGALQCITKSKEMFVNMTKSKQHVSLTNGWKLRASGEGTAYCSCINERLPMLYVPRLIFNLLSVRAMVKAGFVVTFQGDKCLIEK